MPDELLRMAMLLALVEKPELGEDPEALQERALELLALGEAGMKKHARTLPRGRVH